MCSWIRVCSSHKVPCVCKLNCMCEVYTNVITIIVTSTVYFTETLLAVHMYQLLNGLKQSLNLYTSLSYNSDESELNPVLLFTSLPCKYIVLKNQKGSTEQISVAVFNNCDHEKTVKQTLQPTEDFDPIPEEYGGTAKNHTPNLLKKMKGNYLGILLFLDKDYVDQGSQMLEPSMFDLPDVAALRRAVEA